MLPRRGDSPMTPEEWARVKDHRRRRVGTGRQINERRSSPASAPMTPGFSRKSFRCSSRWRPPVTSSSTAWARRHQPSARISPGRQLGPYAVLERIGAGGMGDVYRARDTRLDRLVALKVLWGDAGALVSSERLTTRGASRWCAEASQHLHASRRRSARTKSISSSWSFCQGRPWPPACLAGRLPVAEALVYAEQIASALIAAHRAGIVHRDLTPRNVMLTSVEQGTRPRPGQTARLWPGQGLGPR